MTCLTLWGVGHGGASPGLEHTPAISPRVSCSGNSHTWNSGSERLAAPKKQALPQCGAPWFHLILLLLQPVCDFTLRLKMCRTSSHFSLFVHSWSNGVLIHHGASRAAKAHTWGGAAVPPSSLFHREPNQAAPLQHCSLPSVSALLLPSHSPLLSPPLLPQTKARHLVRRHVKPHAKARKKNPARGGLQQAFVDHDFWKGFHEHFYSY